MIYPSNSEPTVIIEYLRKFEEVTVRNLTQQRYGDYVWLKDSKTYCVERKEIKDYINSLHSGRLEEQLYHCIEEYSKVFLLIEGVPRISYFNDLAQYRSIQGSLRVCSDFVPVLYTASHQGTAETILALYRRAGKETRFMSLKPRARSKPRSWNGDVKVYKLRCLVNRMPESVAEGLIKEFGSISKVGLATDEELMRIGRLGEGLVRNIREAFD